MANYARIQNRIYYGYTKAAIRLGISMAVYRSATAITPIQAGNFLKNTLISIDADLNYNKAKKYGDPKWQFLPQDGLTLQNFDYLVNSANIYYIADIKPVDRLSPPFCVECNSIVKVERPAQDESKGFVGYTGLTNNNATLLMQDINCSLLKGGRSEPNHVNLPTDVRLGRWVILIPKLGNVILRNGDIITDSNNMRYGISHNELTSLGWRLEVDAHEA